MAERVLILDGATGTYLQQLHLTDEDFRGARFADHPLPLKGCNDVLCLTQPEKIQAMHTAYLNAGADIIETNSFNGNCYSLADYGLEDCVYEINKAAAECARKAIAAFEGEALPHSIDADNEGDNGADNGVRRHFVAGSMGPTNKTLSMSSDVNDPGHRDITFQDLYATYCDQVNGLLDGGADIILVETVFDTLNAKAALKAVSDIGIERGMDIPVMVSATLSDASGRSLSGQTVEALAASVSHYPLLSIGLNCGFGAKQLLPWLIRLSEVAQCAISAHPNAGLPNVMGGYDETPETFAKMANLSLTPSSLSPALPRREGEAGAPTIPLGVGLKGCAPFNIYGGCCGTTPAHIKAVAEALKDVRPRPLTSPNLTQGKECKPMMLSGLEPLVVYPQPINEQSEVTTNSLTHREGRGESSGVSGALFINIGERTNVAGSAKFKRLIKEKNYDEALSIARHQVENGAQVIDICMDDGLIDGVEAMTTFLNLIASEPEIARVPVMIDSSKWEILKAGLQCVQGKAIVNSISLKEGEEKFIEKARYIHSMGAATVVMLFDEEGQADTYERKMTVARRAYNILKTIGFPTEDVIFDPNVLSVATGMSEHDDYGRAFIAACETIHKEMPEVHLSGGISNLSFSFRGNNTIRQAMHSVFLHHAMKVGLDMSIVNPAMTTVYEEIPEDMLEIVEAVILNKDPEASERLMTLATKVKEEEEALKAGGKVAATASAAMGNWRTSTLPDRISHAMLKGITDYIADDTMEAYNAEKTALGVIDHYLMPAMEQVGELFGAGKMFLPQVVKSARVMKKAVAVLEPYMKAPTPDPSPEARGDMNGVVLMATVKGDVHDIGKNIVAVVTQCNGYNVEDLGVMVDTETIVDTAQKHNAAVIGLSGLITPSLDEMIKVCRELQKRGMTTPVIVGGATTSALHTAVKMAPEYPDGVVIHSHAAADNAAIIRHLLSDDSLEYIAEIKSQQRIIRNNYLSQQSSDNGLLTLEEARRRRHVKTDSEVATPAAEALKPLRIDVKISQVKELINWNFFYQAWGLKGGEDRRGEEAKKLLADAQQMLREMEIQQTVRLSVMAQVMPARSNDNDDIIISANGKDYILPMPRSLKDEEETKCLADYILNEHSISSPSTRGRVSCSDGIGVDYICPFVVTAGIGLKELQEHYKAQGDEYHAIMAKLLCDRLAEALCDYLDTLYGEKQAGDEKRVGWGNTRIRMAFGYGACPDHKLKQQVFDMLHVREHLPLELTETFMINPGESICGLMFANTPTKYFNV